MTTTRPLATRPATLAGPRAPPRSAGRLPHDLSVGNRPIGLDRCAPANATAQKAEPGFSPRYTVGLVTPALLVVCVATFLALAASALAGLAPGDAWLREAILTTASPTMLTLFEWINLAGSWELLLPAVGLLLLIPHARRRFWLWAALMVIAPSLEWVFKHLIARPRPESPALGFPSGHATAAAAYFAALIYLSGDLPPRARRLVRVLAACLILLVALARVLLRAHWPSDALGGIALGLTCAAIAILIDVQRAEPRPTFAAASTLHDESGVSLPVNVPPTDSRPDASAYTTGLLASTWSSASVSSCPADHSSHVGSSVATSRMTLLSTMTSRIPVPLHCPRVNAMIRSVVRPRLAVPRRSWMSRFPRLKAFLALRRTTVSPSDGELPLGSAPRVPRSCECR